MELDPNKVIVTVLYYQLPVELTMHHEYVVGVKHRGRVQLTDEFKKGKTIVAVIEGKANVLNTLGDRAIRIHAA